MAVSEPAAGDHAHHGHHGAVEPPDTLATILTLPAHCLFCLDGMVPAPVAIPRGVEGSEVAGTQPVPMVVIERASGPSHRLYHCREPPVRLV